MIQRFIHNKVLLMEMTVDILILQLLINFSQLFFKITCRNKKITNVKH